MSDEDLIGYLFDLLDPAERAAVAACAEADPAVAARLDRLRADAAPLLAAMTAERADPPAPRPGLALRAIATAAAHVVVHEPRAPQPVTTEAALAAMFREVEPRELEFASGTQAKRPGEPVEPRPAPPPSDGPEYRSTWFRADLLVAAGIAFLGVGLVLSGVAKARQNSRVVACQNSLRTLHNGLTSYASTDHGRYPQVGTPQLPTADTFAASLVDLGHLPANYKPGCPAADNCPAYTYTLGFRGPGDRVFGLTADETNLMPIAADLPAASAAPEGGPVSPHARCMNVLFVGGNVRVTTSPNIGPRGDDIYRNVYGQVAAGADRTDAVLGGIGSRP